MQTQPDTEKIDILALLEEKKKKEAKAIMLAAKTTSIIAELSRPRSPLKPVLVETRIGSDGTTTKHEHRPFVSSNSLCVYGKGKRKWGYIFTPSSHTADIELKYPGSSKTSAERWRDSWIMVVKYLRASGLWKDMLADVETALDIGYEKLRDAQKAYCNDDPALPYGKNDEANAKVIASIDSRLVVKGKAKTSILWYMARNAKVKKMYFGKYNNETKLAEIARSMKIRQECQVHQRVSYDVSFSYDPKLGKAWYTEEFRDCANGHYYLALNETHALFYEDD